MDTEKLIERLRAVESSASDFVGDPNPRYTTCWHRNPDGPAAADALEASTRRVKELEEERAFIFKWVERGLFDKKVSPTEALNCIAYYPGAPWKTGRWDVDHKPYAEALYKAFPKARVSQEGL